MRVSWRNFTGGEIASTLVARYDLARYANSLKLMRNFIPNQHGDALRRSGFKYIATLPNNMVLYPFIFNTEAWNNYVIAFGDETFSIYNADGPVVEDMDSPFAEEHLYELSLSQVGDVVYVAHEAYPMQKLTRSGTYPYTWAIGPLAFNQSLSAPESVTAMWNQSPPNSNTTYPDKNFNLNYQIVAVSEGGLLSLPSATASVQGRYPTEWVAGDYVTLAWDSVTGAVEYNIYRESAGYYGFVGTSDTTSFRDDNYTPDVVDTPPYDWNPFADGNYPSKVAFHQQRMVIGGTHNEPNTFYMSKTGDFEDFRKSRPAQDDDSTEYTLASNSIDSIAWVVSFGALLVGTSGAEYQAVSSDGIGGPITASDISITPQSFWGSASLPPLVAGDSVLHCQRYGYVVRDLYYTLEKDGYSGNDLTVLATHLFRGHQVTQWCFQQTPTPTVWCVRDDGVLLALTYIREQSIAGWSVHETKGRVKSVCRISGGNVDMVYAVVERDVINSDGDASTISTLEELTLPFEQNDSIIDAFFVDSGVTLSHDEAVSEIDCPTHLQGTSELMALLDGSPIDGIVVDDDDKIVLPYPAKIVTVGIPYTSVLAPMPFNTDMQGVGTSLGLRRSYGRSYVEVVNSVGGSYGSDANIENAVEFPETPSYYGEACEPYSGTLEYTHNGGQEADSTVYIFQNKPLPFQVVAIVADIDFGQRG